MAVNLRDKGKKVDILVFFTIKVVSPQKSKITPVEPMANFCEGPAFSKGCIKHIKEDIKKKS